MSSLATEDEDNVPLLSLAENGELNEHEPGDWIRPLGKTEQFMGVACYLNCANTSQAIWVSSEEPITKPMMETALRYLVKRIPTLNICVQRRWVRQWFRRMSQITFDFEILTGDPLTIFMDVLEKSYSMNGGPLWHVRMVHLSPEQKSPSGVQAKYHVMVVFAIHHVITDSTTNMAICKEFVNILNDLQKNRSVVINPYPLSPPYAEQMVKTSNMDLLKILGKYFLDIVFLDIVSKLTFNNVIPLPKNYEQSKMKHIYHVFSEATTEKLISQSKKNATTVHATIVTATNAAYLAVVKNRSKQPVGEISLLYIDAIDLRRYYPKQDKEHIGYHVTVSEKEEKMSPEIYKNFWEAARASKTLLHDEIESQESLRIIPVVKYGSVILPINIYNNRKRLTNVCDKHYITSNMGDITKRLSESSLGDTIKITDIARAGDSIMTCGQRCAVSFHTFRNRFYLSIEYPNCKMDADVVSELFENMKVNVIDLATDGKLRDLN